MQPKKISNFQKFKIKNKSVNKLKKLVIIKRYLKNKNYNFRRNLFTLFNNKNSDFYKINILFKSNNIFCTLSNLITRKTLYSISSGNYKIKTSKKILKYTYKLILDRFIKISSRKLKQKSLIVNIVCPLHLRKKVIDIISNSFNKQNLILKLEKKKCYNGCRPCKKQRKKRKGLRLLK